MIAASTPNGAGLREKPSRRSATPPSQTGASVVQGVRQRGIPGVLRPGTSPAPAPQMGLAPVRGLRRGDAVSAFRDRGPAAAGNAPAPVLFAALRDAGPAPAGGGGMMAVLFRRDDDRWFLRCFPGYATEAGARAAAKALWLEGNAVRVWPGRQSGCLAGYLTGMGDPGAGTLVCNNLLQGDRQGVTNCNTCMSGRRRTCRTSWSSPGPCSTRRNFRGRRISGR